MTDIEREVFKLEERTPGERRAYLQGYVAGLGRALEAGRGYIQTKPVDEWDRGCNAGVEMLTKEIEMTHKNINAVLKQEAKP